jgi:hypothetical protein
MKRGVTSGKRLNHEPPAVTAKLGWRYHHIGIPHTQPRVQEHHVAHLGVHLSGFETSPYGIERIRFEPHCDVPEIVRSVPHITFAVDDLDGALKGRKVLIAPTEPSPGVRVAFIVDDGAPVELLQFYTVKVVRPKTRHAAEQRAAADDSAPAKEMRRRRSARTLGR